MLIKVQKFQDSQWVIKENSDIAGYTTDLIVLSNWLAIIQKIRALT